MSSGGNCRLTSIWRRRNCSRIKEIARVTTWLIATSSWLTAAARPKVRRCEMISVALRTCCIAWRSSPTIGPFSVGVSSIKSTALPTNKPMLLSALFSSWATPVVSPPRMVEPVRLVGQSPAVLLVVAQDVQHGLPLVGQAPVGLVQVAHDVKHRAALLIAPPQAALQHLHVRAEAPVS